MRTKEKHMTGGIAVGQASIRKNTIFNAIKTLSSIIFPLITFPYVSRVLTPENTGKINFGSSVVSYFSLIASLGITTYAIRECSAVREDKEKLNEVASQIYSINIITTLIAYLALGITLIFYQKLANYRELIIIQSLSIVAITIGADWINSAMEEFRFITIRGMLFQLLSVILMFIFVHKPEDYMKYAIIGLVSSAGANITNIWYRRRFCQLRFFKTLKAGIPWKKHITPIILLFVMILAQNIYSNVDTNMLGLMIGDWEVGIYSAARRVAALLFQVIVSIAWVVMPRMSLYFKEGNMQEANALYRKVFGYFMLIGLPCLLGVGIMAQDVVLIVAGADYTGAGPVLQVIAAGMFFDLFGASLMGNIVFLPSNREKQYMIICCATAVINIITNYLLIPIWGSLGAAITTAFCNLIMFILFIIYREKRIRLQNIKTLMLPPVVGSICIIICCVICSLIPTLWVRVIISVGISASLYFAIQWFMKNELFCETAQGYINKFKARRGKET